MSDDPTSPEALVRGAIRDSVLVCYCLGGPDDVDRAHIIGRVAGCKAKHIDVDRTRALLALRIEPLLASWELDQRDTRQMVVGKAGVSIDAYDAIELLSRRPDHPSRLLAEKARAVADWANDPLPYGSHTRDQVAEIAPELVEALYDLLGGGPGDVSDARPASGGEA